MEQIIIIHADGTTLPLTAKGSARAVTKAEQKRVLLGEDTITISVKTAEPLALQIGDRIEVFGSAYKLNQLPEPTKSGTREFVYNLTFEGPQYDMIDVQWLLSADTVLDSFTGDLEDFIDLLISNLNRVYANKWVKGVFPANTEYKTLTYTEKNALEVLQDLCSQYSVEFDTAYTTNSGIYTLNFRAAVGSVYPYTFSYGRGGGLYNIARKNVSSKSLITRLYAYGGSTNIASSYRYNKLCLPAKQKNQSYIETASAVALYGVRENTKVFSDIYPNRVGSVTALGGNYYTIIDSTMFDLNETDASGNTKWLISGVTAKLKVQSGNLAGYEFDIASYNHTTHAIVLKPFTDENGMKFPSESSAAFQFAVGDKYILTDINLPDSYVTAAESELQTAAAEYAATYAQPQVQYSLKIAENFLQRYAGEGTDVNIFNPGDSIPIQDSDIGVSKTIRITSFTRNLLKPYAYELELGDSVTVSPLTRVIGELQGVQQVIEINQLADPSRARRNWMAAQEVLANVFDPDGQYYSEKIKPLSIETTMLSVGAKSQQLTLLGSRFEANYNNTANSVNIIGGTLSHYTIEVTIRSWTMSSAVITLSNSASPYYLYAVCPRSGNAGTFQFDTTQRTVDGDSTNYYFLIGTISSVITDDDGSRPARILSLTYGCSTVNGRFIKTGRIESSGGGTTYFDIDSGEIGGVIKFINSSGQLTPVTTVESAATEAKNYINNTLPGILEDIYDQLDGQIEQFFETYDPTTSNLPASGWSAAEKESHLGDLFYNTDTGKVFRWVKENSVYKWQELQDSEVAQALALANDALALARTKRRIFTTTPTTPYEVGDLWVQGANGDIMRCTTARSTGNYAASDWEKASNYTNDAALNTFLSGTYATDKSALQTQIDGKIESWWQTTDPAADWSDAATKAKHVGDMWYNTSTKLLKRYLLNGSTYEWSTIEDAKAIAAYAAAGEAQDTADGKRRVFVAEPTTPYDIGDLWVTGNSTNGGILKRCTTARASGSYIATDWEEAVSYDNTQTVIDGGVVTSGTVQLAGNDTTIKAGITGEGTAETSVRMWAGATKANRASAPFRVLQNGKLVATNAEITGTINANAGEFNNVKVKGSSRCPFSTPSDSFDVDYSDNVAMISEGGGWLYAFDLPWTADQSGRRLFLTNYRWGSQYSAGASSISAPSGKYFYENGISKSELNFSREAVELMGYGTSTVFYGWIVIKRIDLMTTYRYGREIKALAVGTVTGSSSGASISAKTFDGSSLSAYRIGEGRYYIVMPSGWFSSADHVFCMVTGLGYSSGSTTAPIKATVVSKSVRYIYIDCSDDASRNDGSFMFFISNINDWIY